MKRSVLIVVVVILAVAGIAFYAMQGYKKPSSSSSSTSSSSSASKAPAQATNAVTIQNFAFSPAAITVKAGTTVTWTNQDSTGHTVVETDSQAGPNSDLLAQGKAYSFTFKTAGTYHYHCSVHPDMTGTVTVTE